MPLIWTFECEARDQGYLFIAGVDEVGRGPLAGPVVAAAAILPVDYDVAGLNDSKKLSPKARSILVDRLKENPSVLWAIAEASVEEIDRLNILQAALLAMRRAVDTLARRPDYLLVDGNKDPKAGIPARLIVKGDSKSPSIAAASILAKEYRDELMRHAALEYPQYGFERHMGYGTKLHLDALHKHGPCPLHRRSFAPVRQLQLFC